jgi:hypothetical protein
MHIKVVPSYQIDMYVMSLWSIQEKSNEKSFKSFTPSHFRVFWQLLPMFRPYYWTPNHKLPTKLERGEISKTDQSVPTRERQN